MRRCIVGLLLLAACAQACAEETPEDLDGTPRDDLLALKGRVCGDQDEPPTFPLRLMFLVDISGGTQFSDPMELRVSALRDALEPYLQSPEIGIDIIAFNHTVLDLTQGYTRDPVVIEDALQLLATTDGLSDFRSALEHAYQQTAFDAQQLSATDRARAHYFTIFVSDGFPNSMSASEDTPSAILAAVDQLINLQTLLQIGGVVLSTRRLAVPAPFETETESDLAKALMESMARHGRGNTRDLSGPSDFAPPITIGGDLPRRLVFSTILATNLNALPQRALVDSIADTDGDGVTDVEEQQRGSDPLHAEMMFDCLSDGAIDADGDRLSACEEQALGTRDDLADTDAGGIPDGDEVRAGMNPSVGDELESSGYDYEVSETDGCLDFEVFNITLAGTLGVGRNRVLIEVGLRPLDESTLPAAFRAACVEVDYIPPVTRTPPDPVLEVREDQFKPLAELDLERDCTLGQAPPLNAP